MICQNCGTNNSPDARFCAKCGADMSAQAPQQQYAPQQQFAPQQQYYAPQPGMPMQKAPQPGKGLAIAGMICGILTLTLFCFFYISLFTGILAIVFGAVAKGKGCRSGMATAGIVCGSIGLGLMLIFLIIAIAEPYMIYDIFGFYYF